MTTSTVPIVAAAPLTTAAYYRRLDGIISDDLHRRRVVAVGCSGGSYLVQKLARYGPAELRLVDCDRVGPENLCRTAFTVADLGSPKPEALARLISAANPFVRTEAWCRDITTLAAAERERLLGGADLIVAGTDSFRAQALLNRWSQECGIPAVFIGVHAGALGGRIVWSVPGETPCYRDVAADRYTWFAAGGDVATDLPGAAGGLVDVQLIDMVALKISLALLERGQDSALGRFAAQMAGRTEVIVRTSPEYEFGAALWDAVLGDLPVEPRPYAREIKEQALFAADSIWLRTEPLPGCPDCALVPSSTGEMP